MRRHATAYVLLLAATALVLHLMGRSWWCRGGGLSPWSGDIWSMHNSQHVADPYTFTHLLHGLALYGVLWLVIGRTSHWLRAWLAVGSETAWEIAENTDAVIQRYRESTLALNYYGDSIVNSLADIIAFVAGYVLASLIPTWTSAAGFVLVDVLLALSIRDSLVLNVVMLIHPVEAIKEWQMGGMP